MSPLVIVQDTRERNPWTFDGIPDVVVERRTLKTGDYSLSGSESAIAIERKATPVELAGCLAGPSKDRFRRELERLTSYEHAHVVLAFSRDDLAKYPAGAGLARSVEKKIRARGKYLCKLVHDLQEEFPSIAWHFVGSESAGRDLAVAILRRVAQADLVHTG